MCQTWHNSMHGLSQLPAEILQASQRRHESLPTLASAASYCGNSSDSGSFHTHVVDTELSGFVSHVVGSYH